jgi:drug/metabolite transporter (DMT)-like permease
MWDIFRGLVFTMSICLVAMGVLGLVVAASHEATPRLLSRMALVLALASAALTALYWVYRVPPPLITMAVVTILFVVSVATTSRSADARAST